MQTPDNLAGRITEEIMIIFSRFNDVAEVALPTDKYNLVYSHIYGVLDKHLPNKPLQQMRESRCFHDNTEEVDGMRVCLDCGAEHC
ncbi:MAG: hypothetical protein ACTSQ8_25950 [Candidatus Helarchaeota archaeon]